MAINVTIENNAPEVRKALENQIEQALMTVGLAAEGDAKDLCPWDTGLLRNSITFALSGEGANISTYKADSGGASGSYSGTAPDDAIPAVYVGTNVHYAIFQEMGTSRQTTAHPFIGPAVKNGKSKWMAIIKKILQT